MKGILFMILALFWNKSISQNLNICNLPSLNKEQVIAFWDDAAKINYTGSEKDSLINVYLNDETMIEMHSDSLKHWLRALAIYSNDKKFIKEFLSDNPKDYLIKGREHDTPKVFKIKCNELILLSKVRSTLPEYKYYYEVYFTYKSEETLMGEEGH